MSKIQFEQINDNELEISIPSHTPMEMVNQLTKSLNAKGLTEDLSKSTLSLRYFVRKQDSVNTAADKLIKSLQSLAKDDAYWSPKSQFEHQRKMREMDIADRRAKNGVKQPTNISTAPEPHIMPDTKKNPSPTKMYDSDPANQATAGGTGKRYAYIANKTEDELEDEDSEVNKSNYKGAGVSQYKVADNVRRKANNTGDQVGSGPNVNAKAYSSKPGQMSSKQSAALTAKIQNAANKKQPVTSLNDMSPEKQAEMQRLYGDRFKKSWGEHLPFPSAEEEILKLAKATAQSGEQAAATQLADVLMGKKMLGKDVHPVIAQMMAPPPPQPTDQQMFGHLVVTEEMAKNAEQQWNGAINNWLAEATKPISQRFASEEEELAYWSKIKVSDSGGDHGY